MRWRRLSARLAEIKPACPQWSNPFGLVRVLVFCLREPCGEDGGEIRLHHAKAQAHTLVGFAEGNGGVGFEEFVAGVNLDDDIFAGRQGIGRFDITAAGA